MCWLTKAWPSTTSVMRIFQVGAERENGALDRKRCHRARSVTASAAQDDGTEGAGAGHRIVHSPRDRTLANQKSVRDSCETLQCVFVFVGDRLAGAIRAGHDQNFRGAGSEQQVVQRSVGQHHAEFVVVRERRR